MEKYNDGSVTRWLMPDGSDFLPPGTFSLTYNMVESEIPANSHYDDNGKTQMTAQKITRTFRCNSAINKTSLRVFINDIALSQRDFKVSSSTVFTVDSNQVGNDGWLWVSYEFSSISTKRKYDRSISIPGSNIVTLPAVFKVEYMKELCDTINNIETFLKLPQTLWIGGQFNESHGRFNIIKGTTPLSIDHFVQIARSLNELVIAVSTAAGGINIEELSIDESLIPVEKEKLWVDFMEKCRSTIYELELILIKM